MQKHTQHIMNSTISNYNYNIFAGTKELTPKLITVGKPSESLEIQLRQFKKIPIVEVFILADEKCRRKRKMFSLVTKIFSKGPPLAAC